MNIKYFIIPAALFVTVGFCYAQTNDVKFERKQAKAEPHMQKVLDALKELGPKQIELLTPEEARKQPTPADAVKQVLKDQGKKTDPDPSVSVKDMTISGPIGEIPIHVYTPARERAISNHGVLPRRRLCYRRY